MTYKFRLRGKVPSKKNRYKQGRGRVYLDPEVTGWIDAAAWELKSQFMRIYSGSSQITTPIYFNAEFITDNRSDLDNMVSTIFDALQLSGVIKNDRQIVSLRSMKHVMPAKQLIHKCYVTLTTDIV